MAKEWADIVINESEIAHATMGDEEARLRKAVEIARAELRRVEGIYDDLELWEREEYVAYEQEQLDDAIFALNDAGYEE